ncbi:MAG: tyrosine-type recombinase/integrase [Woeseia sp.]
MELPPNCRIKNGRVYLVRREAGKVKWTPLTRVSEGEAAAHTAWKHHADRPTTVAELLALYSGAPDGLLSLKPNTQDEYKRAITLHLNPRFGSAKPPDVTQQGVAMFLDSLGNVAANRAVATLSSAYNWGMRKGYVPHNPCRGVRRNRERARTRYVSNAELRDALSRAAPAFRLLLEAAYLTGLRQGDLRRIRQAQARKEGLLLQESKRGKQILVRWSDALRLVVADAMAHAGDRQHGGRLFTNEYGRPWTRPAVQSALRRLKLDFTFHDLRAKAESDSTTGLGLLTRYKRAHHVDALDGMLDS